jgi:Ornithine cyclodeaminase/mu-crystallin family
LRRPAWSFPDEYRRTSSLSFRATATCSHRYTAFLPSALGGTPAGQPAGSERRAAHVATTVAVIGAGRQASMQLRAITAVQTLSHVHVYSRDPARPAVPLGRIRPTPIACCIIRCMICRPWGGWATKDNADAYERIVRGQVIPGIEAQRIPGFRLRGIDPAVSKATLGGCGFRYKRG